MPRPIEAENNEVTLRELPSTNFLIISDSVGFPITMFESKALMFPRMNVPCDMQYMALTPALTGGKKRSAVWLFDVRVDRCLAFLLSTSMTLV